MTLFITAPHRHGHIGLEIQHSRWPHGAASGRLAARVAVHFVWRRQAEMRAKYRIGVMRRAAIFARCG
ncbi:hypothetical protein [Cupriavidus basilensis]|uniref:hypothetical protein n=1 Tax=Cupriavidus basilensis TaxID=68895 RepID=UPI001186CDFC|nr:hypothetical protein [Cupriavidus basilensis]